MKLFYSDYLEGCLPQIMEKLTETNLEQTPGYGNDTYCEKAKNTIRKVCNLPDADVHFLVGGTQTNATVIASILKPYQGVIAGSTGHIAVHETGAIEMHGHKVITLPAHEGKISACDIDALLSAHHSEDSPEHCVQPAMVYISFSTELGSLYTKEELMQIKSVCTKWDIPLFIDGARLGYGLVASQMTIDEFASIPDIFYIGGTKQGALFGEAVVISNDRYKKDFRYYIKQNGGLLAKGRLLGIQFQTLFEDGLYFKAAEHAVSLAAKLSKAFESKGYELYAASPTNQIFPILSVGKAAQLAQHFGFEKWAELGPDRCAYRFCTSWATTEEAVDELISML